MPDDAELVQFYQQFAFEKPQREDVEHDVPAIQASLRHFIGLPKSGRNRFLDYGGGFGIYCRAARGLGWEPSLFDYDLGCLDYARSVMGVERAAGDLAEFKGEQFDVIWGFHVIEHWNRIDENMKALLELLAPGGRIVFATPHAESAEKWVRPYHILKYARGLVARGEKLPQALSLTLRLQSFLCWDPPRHLFAFSAESLRAIGRRHGLESTIAVGYNTSPIYEPRQYVLANPFAPRFKVPRGASTVASALRKFTACFSWAGCKVLAAVLPRHGEQLYVTLTRQKAQRFSET
jgi:SAM-dependent methyltransferase